MNGIGKLRSCPDCVCMLANGAEKLRGDEGGASAVPVLLVQARTPNRRFLHDTDVLCVCGSEMAHSVCDAVWSHKSTLICNIVLENLIQYGKSLEG